MTEGRLPFDVEPPPRQPRRPRQLVRPSDPETSHEAAQHAVEHLRVLQERVLTILRECGPLWQHALIAEYRERYGEVVPESTIRTRLRGVGRGWPRRGQRRTCDLAFQPPCGGVAGRVRGDQ